MSPVKCAECDSSIPAPQPDLSSSAPTLPPATSLPSDAIRAGEPGRPAINFGLPSELDVRKPRRWPLLLALLPLLVSLLGGFLWLVFDWDPIDGAAWAGLGLLLSLAALLMLYFDRLAPRRRLCWPIATLGLGLGLMPALPYGVDEAKDYYHRTPHWTRYTAPDGKWSILMPAEVKVEPHAKIPKGMLYISSLSANRGAFIVLAVPTDPQKPPEVSYAAVKKMWLASPNTRLFKESNIVLGGRYRGLDMYIGKTDSELAHHMRMFVVRDKCYILNCGSEYLDNQEFAKFLDSFEVHDKR